MVCEFILSNNAPEQNGGLSKQTTLLLFNIGPKLEKVDLTPRF